MSRKPQPPKDKKTPNPRRRSKTYHVDYFETIYGDINNFDEDLIPKFSPRYAGYQNVAMKSLNSLPRAPSPIKLDKAKKIIEESREQCIRSAYELPTFFGSKYSLPSMHSAKNSMKKLPLVPVLTIPKRQPQKTPVTARPSTVVPLSTPIEVPPMQTPRAANDNLALFDETDFETKEYNESIKKRLKNGPIPAYSIFATNNNQYEWKECTLIEINGKFYTIRWNDTGKTKVVQRLAVRLQSESETRFEQRRELASKNREDTVASIKMQTYIHLRATESDVQHEPTMMENIIKKLPSDVKKSKLLPGLIQEINELYTFSHIVNEYKEEWNDPEKAQKYMDEGLSMVEKRHICVNCKVYKLNDQLVKAIRLPSIKQLIKANTELVEFMNDPVVENCLRFRQKTVSFAYYLTSILELFQYKYYYAKELLLPSVKISLTKLLGPYSDKETVFCNMMNLRINYAIGTSIINTLDDIVPMLAKNNVYFRLTSMEDLETFVPSRSVLNNVGITYINMITDLFNTHKLRKVSFEFIDKDLLTVFLPRLEERRNQAKEDWVNMIDDGFNQIQQYINEMRETTKDIPLYPNEECIKILPHDFEDFIKEGKMPTVDPREINLRVVRQKLSAAINAHRAFIMKFKPNQKFGVFNIDFTKFFDFIRDKKDEFYNNIFRYMNAQTDKQVNLIGGMISSLIEKTTAAPKSVEEWYDKHVILLHIMSHVNEIQATLDYLLVMMNFMSEFLFEPEQSFKATYEIKNNLHNVILGINDLKRQDNKEKIVFIDGHRRDIEAIKSNIKNFQEDLLEYNKKDVNVNAKKVNDSLLEVKKRFDSLVETCSLYKERDRKLEITVTEYPLLDDILQDFNIYIPIWNISYKIEAEANDWLGTMFKQLDVPYITKTIVDWEKIIKGILADIEKVKRTERHRKYTVNGEHALVPSVKKLLERVQYYILHLPVIKYLCNPYLRTRHWTKISEVTGIKFGPNDGVTWVWLIEIGLENNIVEVASISKSAEIEAKIERAITGMCEDISSISFKVTKKGKKIKLMDPSTALLMLNKHQQIMQEIFIPPYVQIFISKIKEYEALAANVRNILKQSIETEERINELTPAMDSTDLRSQHNEMTKNFDTKVKNFKHFAETFKISATFHRILSNQATADLSDKLSNDFVHIKKKLLDVLEMKRKAFPRFRLLSDSQLIYIISNSDDPSSFADMFSMMFPAIKVALFENNRICTGFKSFGGEVFEFVKKVKVNPKCVEGWMIEFENQIKFTLVTLGKKLMQAPISNIEKMALTYPSQLLSLVFEITFTSNVNKCFASFEGNFTEYAKPKLIEQLNIVLDAVNKDLRVLKIAYRKTNSVQISNMVVVCMNHKYILEKLLESNVLSRQNPTWLSTPKYTVRDMDKFLVDVTVGACTIPYGFEYSGNNFPIVLTEEMRKFFSQMMSGTCGGAMPLTCGWSADRKSNYVMQFLNGIGRQPFVYPCHHHTSLERMKEFIDKAAQCNSYVIFKDIYSLKYNVLSDFATELVAMKQSPPTHIFATYTYKSCSTMHIPEILKLAFNPIDITNLGYKRRFEVIITAMGADSSLLAEKLANLVKTVTKAFKEPLNSAFSFLSLLQLVQSAPILSDNPCHEIHKRIIDYTVKKFGKEQASQLIKYVDAVFEERSVINVEKVTLTMHPDPTVNKCLINLHELIKVHYGVIISGPSLSGKSALIKMYCKNQGLQPKYINPLSIDLSDLYGDKDSGVLSTILQDNDTIVFDGPCDPSWIETLALGLSSKRRMYFGDGSMLNLRDNVRFIIETTDISQASPAILALCGTINLDSGFLSTKQRINFFVEKVTNDPDLIEPITQTIISSQVPVTELSTTLYKVITFFMEYVDSNEPLTCFFKFVMTLIYNYYLPSMDSDHVHHTAQQLIDYIPNFVAFAFYWSWAGRVVNDARNKFDVKFTKASAKYGIDLKGHNISEVYFDSTKSEWVPWADIETEKITGDSLKLIDSEPKHLLFDPAIFRPILYIARILFSKGRHLLLSCHQSVDQSVLANIIQHIPFVMDHFSPKAYIFSKEFNHKMLRKMLSSVLPETNTKTSASSIALRLPLLSILGFHSNQRSTSSELIRYIIAHKEIPSEFGVINEQISGLVLLMCGDEDALKTRVSNHTFSIAVPKISEAANKRAVSLAINRLWGIESQEIGSIMVDFFNNVKKIFKFSIYHLFTVLQRIGIITVNYEPSKIVDVIAYQLVNIFYDAYHDNEILSNISIATRDISKVLGYECNTDVFEVAGKSILTNVNASYYRPVSCFGDLQRKRRHRPSSRRHSSIRFTSSDGFEDKDTEIQRLRGINNSLRYDILATISIITTPMCHLKFYTEIPKLSRKLVKNACRISKSVMCVKHLYVPLIKSFHDAFIEAGKTKVHHVLFIDENTLTKEDLTILGLLQKTTNVYGIFSRTELLDIITEIYTKKGLCSDPFQEDSIETRKDYNQIIADFITDCKMYFHFAVVSLHLATPNSNCAFTAVYTPYFGAKDFVDKCIETQFNNLVSFDTENTIKHHFVIDTFNKIAECPLIKRCPYLVSAQNLSHIVKAFVERANRRHDEIKEQMDNIESILNVNKTINQFMKDQIEKMNNMEAHLVSLKKKLQQSTADLVTIKKETEIEMENANREAIILNEEKSKAEKLQLEISQALRETNKILETALAGIRNIKASDIAVIKNMHHPPRGVVLVIMALCVILGQNVNINATTDEDFAKIFNIGRSVMSDAGFLKKITNAVHASLSPQILEAIRKIVSNPKFEPNVIERSSTAAKTICIFIRAIIPYSEAMECHKAKVKIAEEVQDNLGQLQEKYTKALEKYNKCQKEQLQTSTMIEDMGRQIERTKDSIVTQNNKIEDYKIFQSIIDKYISDVEEKYANCKDEADKSEAISFLMSTFSSIAGPFNDEERDQLFDVIKFGNFTRKDILSTDESVVCKWKRTNAPISWHWKENTSFLSPENGRWVVCQNAFMLSTNYLRKVINRQSVSFISAHSPTFDDDFVSSISAQVGIVIYDFDFINPNLVVPVVCRARETGVPFVYNNETIKVPKDFFVVFDCRELPEYYSFGMDVELVRFNIDDSENTEQIAIRSFELLCNTDYIEANKCDMRIINANEQIAELEEQLKSSFINSGSKLFSDKKGQVDFKVLLQHISEEKNKIELIRSQYQRFYSKFGEIHDLAKSFVAEFKRYTVTSSLWKMFEGAFALRDSMKIEDFNEVTRKVMVPYLASITQGTHGKDSIKSIETIVRQSKNAKPVIIVSKDSAFPFNALFNIFSESKFLISTPKNSKSVVAKAIQIGTPVSVVCTSNESLIDIYGTISKNLNANFVGTGFRLFICVLGDNIKLSSDLLTKSDIIYFSHPSTVENIVSATQYGMKPELIKSGIPRLDAEISIANRQKYGARVHCFENARLSLQCCNILNKRNENEVFEFIKDYLYTNGNVENKKESTIVRCSGNDSIDLSNTAPNIFIETAKVEYALTERKNALDLVAYIDLEGRDNGQVIGNFEILGNIGRKKIIKPTFSIRHLNKSMKPAPLYTEGKVIVTFYVTNDVPLELVTL